MSDCLPVCLAWRHTFVIMLQNKIDNDENKCKRVEAYIVIVFFSVFVFYIYHVRVTALTFYIVV